MANCTACAWGFCVLGALLLVGGGITTGVMMKNAVKNIVHWQVEEQKSFTLECDKNDLTEELFYEVLLFAKADVNCNQVFASIKVAFSGKGGDPEVLNNCTSLPNDAMLSEDNMMYARRLSIEPITGFMPVASFHYMMESNNATDTESSCSPGKYTITSSEPLWAIDLADETKRIVRSFVQLIGDAILGFIVFVLGLTSCCISGCVFCCAS